VGRTILVQPVTRAFLGAIALGAVSAWGCRIPQGFDSPEAMARVDAALEATERGDRESLPHLIEMLDSDDPFVRLVGIRALERLTGETRGYRHDDPAADRRRAADRWAEWWTTQPESGAGRRGPESAPLAGEAAHRSEPVYPWGQQPA